MLHIRSAKTITYFILTCFTIAFTTASAQSNYTCPKPDLVAAKTLSAINQGLNEVSIQTNYGILTATIDNQQTVKAELEGGNALPTFEHASILFQNLIAVAYDVECAYYMPELKFYLRDTKPFIGASDYFWYARGQGQQGPYAWCDGKGNGVNFCSFIDKPSTKD